MIILKKTLPMFSRSFFSLKKDMSFFPAYNHPAVSIMCRKIAKKDQFLTIKMPKNDIISLSFQYLCPKNSSPPTPIFLTGFNNWLF